MWSLLSEFFSTYLAANSKLVQTLVPLLFFPGRLTREFFAGRRARYLSPVRLYVFVSLVYFLLAAYTGVLSSVNAADTTEFPVNESQSVGFDAAVEAFVADVMNNPQAFAAQFMHTLPRGIFLMIPIAAGMLQLLYLRDGRHYVEHIVFCLHVHTVFFIVAIALEIAAFALQVNAIDWIGKLVLWLGAGYVFVAMYTYYSKTVAATAWRFVLHACISYTVGLTVALAVPIAVAYRSIT